MYKIKLEKKVLKFLSKHKWEKIIETFIFSLKILKYDPYNNRLDIKSIIWSKNNYRLRIWKYRFLYEIYKDKLIITFTAWDSRWDIYK